MFDQLPHSWINWCRKNKGREESYREMATRRVASLIYKMEREIKGSRSEARETTPKLQRKQEKISC